MSGRSADLRPRAGLLQIASQTAMMAILAIDFAGATMTTSEAEGPGVANYAFQLVKPDFATLAASPYELFIIEGWPLASETADLTDAEIAKLVSDGRRVIGYVNASVTDANRPYWQDEWTKKSAEDLAPLTDRAPDWLTGQPVNQFGIITKFWHPQWQKIVIDQAVDLVSRGYSGVYLDDVGRYYDLVQAEGGDRVNEAAYCANAMMQLVVAVHDAITEISPNAYLIVNGDPYIVTNTIGGLSAPQPQAFLAAIDAMLLDNLFGAANHADYQFAALPEAVTAALKNVQHHALLLAIEHGGTQAEFKAFAARAWALGIVPYTSPTGDYDTLSDLIGPTTIADDGLLGGGDP